MKYRIIIERASQDKTVVGREWKIIGQERVPVDESVPDKYYTKDVYGYTPEVETIKDTQETIYDQLVEDLDIPKVIAVINNINQGN